MGSIVIASTHSGPPGIGHGGYVAGFLTPNISGAAQVTLRRPAPLNVELQLANVIDDKGDRWELRDGDGVIADAIAATLELDVPAAPSLEEARAAEAGSPSRWHTKGVHPTCFGCALFRDDDIGLAVGVGPVDGRDGLVAGVWRPRPEQANPHMVIAAIDCPGAMAFIAQEQSAGLLGRMVVEQFAPVRADEDHIVMAWQMDVDGRKLFAGTALTTADGTVVAASKQTWFGRG